MSLLDKIKKNSTIKDSAVLATSKFFTKKDMISTSIPMVNVALSGRLDGGLTPGLTMWAGPSKHFKTAFSLLMAKSYMDKYEDSVMLFYDSEFGTPQSYFDTFGIDTERVLHTPLTDIEQLKFDIMKQLEGFERGEHIIIVIDSIGNLASKKEVDDALDGKSVADMSRAKHVKSLIRLVTPPGGHVLDPFNGSGSTGCAAVELDMDYTGIELDPAYVEIARRRIAAWHEATHPNTFQELFE
jgi:RecA/RadA recombinase